MFDKLKLKTKISLLVAASLVGLVLVIAFGALTTRNDLLEGRKTQIRSVVETVYNALNDLHAQEKAGKLTREQAQKAAVDAIRMARYGGEDGKAEYVYAHTLAGVTVYHVKAEMIGEYQAEKIKDGQGRYTLKDMIAALQGRNSAFVDTSFPRPGSQVPVDKLQFVMKFEPWNWLIGTGVYMDDVDASVRSRLVGDFAVAGVIVAIVALLGFAVARGVLRQVGGEPAGAIGLMSAAAAGDLTVSAPESAKGSMLDSMGDMVSALRGIIREIAQSSGRLRDSAVHISRSSQEVAEAAHVQSDATSAMAAAIEEMTVSINHISDNADETRKESQTSVQLAEEGYERIQAATLEIRGIASSVSEASGRIEKLEERARQISSIANVIKEIAGQTNLLALNAAIEAARAGEQGRGFAVVADEVRKLAERTSAATIEIEEMISGIQTDTTQVVATMNAALPQVTAGVQATEQTAESLQRIQAGAGTTMRRIHEVAASTREQSAASDSIAQKVESIATMVEETAAAMRANAETAADLERIAGELGHLVSRFRC